MELQPAAERRQRQRETTRRAILDATEALLVEGGAQRFSMRRLADRCGYTAPTVYHYFGDKQGLLDTLLEERFEQLLRRLRRVPASTDPMERARQLSRAFVRFGLRHPTHYRLVTTSQRQRGSRPPSAEKCVEIFEEPMQALADQGRLLLDRDAAQQSSWATVHGLIMLRSERPDYPWARNIVNQAIDVMLRGMTVRETPSKPNGAPS